MKCNTAQKILIPNDIYSDVFVSSIKAFVRSYSHVREGAGAYQGHRRDSKQDSMLKSGPSSQQRLLIYSVVRSHAIDNTINIGRA